MTRPAGSEQFEAGTLTTLHPFEPPRPISRQWAFGSGRGAGVKVAVIDSGVDGSHPQVGGINGGVAVEWDPDAPGEVRYVDGPHDDLFGHGTACAAIIRSLAPDCEIHSVRVLGRSLTGKGLVFAGGLRWAIDRGMQVVNLSLSTGKRQFFEVFHEIADEAYFRNVMLVSAVNNVAGPSYPSQYSSVFSVACHPGKDPERFDYNPSPPVEFGAPGIDVDVAWKDGATITATGNSFAAPHIAGLVTRIVGEHPGMTPFQVKTVLHALADNNTRVGPVVAAR